MRTPKYQRRCELEKIQMMTNRALRKVEEEKRNTMDTLWIPELHERVEIQIPGMDQPQRGTICWHGMMDADWGGFSVHLDEKHPKYTQTIGPYRADKFKEYAKPLGNLETIPQDLNETPPPIEREYTQGEQS